MLKLHQNKWFILFFLGLFSLNSFEVFALIDNSLTSFPTQYTELLSYVQQAPDQGETNTCLFVANTGAIELLANKKAKIKNPQIGGTYDLSESFIMWKRNPSPAQKSSFYDSPVLRFNGEGIHIKHWPFEAWINGRVNKSVWYRHPQMDLLPRITLPQVETLQLFQFGRKWTTRVLQDEHIEMIKKALIQYRSPILVNYNDEGYWHVVLIVGFDDHQVGTCYDTPQEECRGEGSFYVRDSFGVKVELRDYDWFRVKGNAAFVVKLK